MADTNSGGAIIPAGSQLDDPVAAGQPKEVDPFNNPNWLSGDEFGSQQSLDADPNNPGIDVFGSNINDLPQDISVPGTVQQPQVVEPTPVVPTVEATPVVPDAMPAVDPAAAFAAMPDAQTVPLAEATPTPAVLEQPPLTQPLAQPVVVEPEVMPAFVPAAVETPIIVAPEQLAVAAISEDPSNKAVGRLVDQVISPKARRSFTLIVIFILVAIVFFLSSATIYLMLRGTVNVTINSTRTGSSETTSVTTTTAQTTSATTTSGAPTKIESIYTYMILLSADKPGEQIELDDLPEGSIELSNGYLVRVLLDEEISTSEPVKEALSELFEIKDATYGEQKYRNYLSRANLTVQTEKGSGETGELAVKLSGEFTLSQESDVVYAKQQIERTIENYTLNYRISLNGSESEYNCIGKSDTDCR